MSKIWNYFKNLFQEAEQSSPSNPLIHQLIERTTAEKQDYDFWKNTLVRRRMMDWLNDQFAIFKVLPDDIDDALDFLDTPSSKGFAVYFHKTQYSQRDVTHFFDYLKERVLQLDYRTQISDLRTYNRPNWVETVQRHYLKPKPDFMRSGKFDQRFGNVMIELFFRDEQPHQVLFRATTYKDHLFKDAEDFQDLMQRVCMS